MQELKPLRIQMRFNLEIPSVSSNDDIAWVIPMVKTSDSLYGKGGELKLFMIILDDFVS